MADIIPIRVRPNQCSTCGTKCDSQAVMATLHLVDDGTRNDPRVELCTLCLERVVLSVKQDGWGCSRYRSAWAGRYMKDSNPDG